jgi:hypothetical protein
MECSCCCEVREPSQIAALKCHDEIKICRTCLGWLRFRAGGLVVTPTLPVLDIGEATRFFEAAGFDIEHYSGDFAFVHAEGQSVFDLERIEGLEPESNHAGCYITTGDVDGWRARLATAGLSVTPIQDMSWGMREFTLRDPNNNRIRIGQALDPE